MLLETNFTVQRLFRLPGKLFNYIININQLKNKIKYKIISHKRYDPRLNLYVVVTILYFTIIYKSKKFDFLSGNQYNITLTTFRRLSFDRILNLITRHFVAYRY